jgi:colicin import membrane protein
MRSGARVSKGKLPATIMAVVVHLLLFALLFFGVSWQTRQAPPVEVELWSKLPDKPVADPAPRKEPLPEPPVEKAAPEVKPEPKPEPVAKPEPEPAPPPKPDLALKEKEEKERKLKEQAEQKEKEAKEKEKETKEKARKEQEAKDRKAKDEAAALAQKEKQEKEVAQKAEQEEAARQQAAQQAAAEKAAAEKAAQQSAINNYIAKIREKIRSNTDVPDGVKVGTRLIVKLVVLPTGEVLSSSVVGGSGDKLYNDAVERGIKRAEPLPLPDDPKLRQLFRSFDLTLTHEK